MLCFVHFEPYIVVNCLVLYVLTDLLDNMPDKALMITLELKEANIDLFCSLGLFA